MEARLVAAMNWLRLRRSPIATLDDVAQAAAACKEAAADAWDFGPLRVLRFEVTFNAAGFPVEAGAIARAKAEEAPC